MCIRGRHYLGQSWLGQAGFVRPGRLIDWLELLGFAVEKRLDGCYRPPLMSPAWLQRLTFFEQLGQQRLLPGGGFYCLLAGRQLVVAPIPILRRRRTHLCTAPWAPVH